MADLSTTATRASNRKLRPHVLLSDTYPRELTEEMPVALVYNGVTLVVMMATPADLTDFATGFTLTEGLATSVIEVDVVQHASGVECQIALDPDGRQAVERRRRSTIGGSSCGICGMKSLVQAVRIPSSVAGHGFRIESHAVVEAVDSLRDHQPLHDRTRAAHAAGFFIPGQGLFAVREDVGRHNALDKLVGTVSRRGIDPASGVVVLTSRVSIEMVQKAAAFGASTIVAVSAPTALAVRVARVAGITLVCNVRAGRYEVHSHPFRVIADKESSEVSAATYGIGGMSEQGAVAKGTGTHNPWHSGSGSVGTQA